MPGWRSSGRNGTAHTHTHTLGPPKNKQTAFTQRQTCFLDYVGFLTETLLVLTAFTTFTQDLSVLFFLDMKDLDLKRMLKALQ